MISFNSDLFCILHGIKFSYPRLNSIVFTGYDYDVLKSNKNFAHILEHIDMIVAGPYVESLKTEDDGLVASTNQKMILLNETCIVQIVQVGVECIIDEETGDMT